MTEKRMAIAEIPDHLAAINGLIIVTANVTDFMNFEGVTIENWFV